MLNMTVKNAMYRESADIFAGSAAIVECPQPGKTSWPKRLTAMSFSSLTSAGATIASARLA